MALFTEQLFINLVLPHIEILDLLTMRRISSAIKAIADRRLFAHIRAEVMVTRDQLLQCFGAVYIQKFALNEQWQPGIIDDRSVLLHFVLRGRRITLTYRYNIITKCLQNIDILVPICFWPTSGYIPATINKTYKGMPIIDAITQDVKSLFC